MAIQINTIAVGATRHSARESESVQSQNIGVRFTGHSVVFYDLETEDQWLVLKARDFKTLAQLQALNADGGVNIFGHLTDPQRVTIE
jgi:hypothetical protein